MRERGCDPSPLEYDLGKASGAQDAAVCAPNGQVLFTGKNNMYIAQTQDPYFLNPSSVPYEELFAEEFATLTHNDQQIDRCTFGCILHL